MDDSPYARPPTPQAVLHRAPDMPHSSSIPTKPNKYIVLLLAPTFVAGKVQIATMVSRSLSCPLFQGDSLHESSAKAAAVGASRSDDGGKARYQRMWLSKMTRTGLLFPDESRPANEGFSGFGGASSSGSTSRRGSGSSISSVTSLVSSSSTAEPSALTPSVDVASQFMTSGGVLGKNKYVNQPVFTVPENERRRKANPALMVLTHPALEPWHKDAIRQATSEYGIGIIFVPLFRTEAEQVGAGDIEGEEKELPVLRPLDPRMIKAFSSFDAFRAATGGGASESMLKYGHGRAGCLEEEIMLEVDVRGNVEETIEEVVRGARNVMFT